MGSTCLGGFIFWCEQIFEWRGSHGVVGRGGEVPFVQMEDNRGSPLIEVWVLGAGAPCDGTSTVGLWAGGFFFFFWLGEAVGSPPVLLRGQGQNPSDAWKRWGLLCWLEWAKPEAGVPGILDSWNREVDDHSHFVSGWTESPGLKGLTHLLSKLV